MTRPRRVDLSMHPRADADGGDVVRHWRASVSTSRTPALLVNADGVVQAVSPPAADLLSTRVTRAIGRDVLELMTLVDFHSGLPTREYAQRIPPLVAIEGRMLSRGLFRITAGDRLLTLDAVAAPLYDADGEVAGSLTFLADVNGTDAPIARSS